MKNKLVYRGIVFLTIVFVGASVIPSMGVNVVEKNVTHEYETTFTTLGSRGYIQDLIDNASDGDTIYIPSGTYYEDIIIEKSISLVGEDKNNTIIDGNYWGTVVSIVSDWVNISGFTIKNTSECPGPLSCYGVGIQLDSCNNTISGNILTENVVGIELLDSEHNIIINNTIINNTGERWGGGIILTNNSNNNTISGNTITNNYANNYGYNPYRIGITVTYSYRNIIVNNIFIENGISFSGAINNIIQNNTISNSDNGIYLMDSSCDNIISENSFFNSGLFISSENVYDNNVTNNMVNGKPLVYVYNKSDLVLDVDSGQIILVNCTNVTIQNQLIVNTTHGILLCRSNNCVISNNSLTSNLRVGIYISTYSDNNTIIYNNINSNNDNGIYLSGSNNTIIDNNITNNSKYNDNEWFYHSAIFCDGSQNNIIGNNISSNYQSGLIHFFCNNTIMGNIISNNNNDGLMIYAGYKNNIINNTIANNNYNGINLVWSGYCGIINNIIISNNEYGIGLAGNSNNNIINNTISNNEYGIGLTYGGDHHIRIINNTVINNKYGINIDSWGVYNNSIINNTITNNIYYGIRLGGERNIIISNNISNSWYGILLGSYSSNNNITGNNISNNDFGICLWFSSGNIITGNTMVDDGIFIQGDTLEHWNTHVIDISNTVNGKPVIYWKNQTGGTIPSGAGQVILANCTNVLVENQNISNGSVVIQLGFSSSCIITGNNINSNNEYGIYLWSSSSNTITGNAITNNNFNGINISSGSSNTLTKNIISNNGGDGLILDYSIGNIITSNTISNNWGDSGISLFGGDSNTITSNNVTNNKDGIILRWSSINTITGNNINSNNGDGINLSSFSDHNSITGNNILNNRNGIYFYHSNDNNIYHNNLINNEQNAHDFHRNMWYDAELQEGNYWSDYTGIDFNGDGIGDIPYDIPGGSNQDLYPFMEPDGWLKEPEFQKAFIIGKITNLIATGKYITFEAVKTRVITFKPFSFHKYVSGEKLILSKDYLGLIGVRYIFALCEITIKI